MSANLQQAMSSMELVLIASRIGWNKCRLIIMVMDISYLTEGMYMVPWATVPTLQKFTNMSNEIVITRHQTYE